MKKIAIVGLTNRGKSSLFNKIIGKNISIVMDLDNTTVDYIGYHFQNISLYDTAGVEYTESLPSIVFEADIIVYLIDISGILDKDKKIIKEIKKNFKGDFIIVVNKFDLIKNNYFTEDLRMFTGNVFFISCISGYGIGELLKYLEIERVEKEKSKKTIGIIGRCNTGKSLFLNNLLRYDRSVVSEKAGTTRDYIMEEKNNCLFIDTAGYKNDNDPLLEQSLKKTREIIKFAEISIIVVDLSVGFTFTDKKLMYDLLEMGKGVILLLNKRDLLTKDEIKFFKNMFKIPKEVPFLLFSNMEDNGKNILPIIETVWESKNFSISRTDLNNWFSQTITKTMPIGVDGRKKKLPFIKQDKNLTFLVFSNVEIKNAYLKYLSNKFTNDFNLKGVKATFKRIN